MHARWRRDGLPLRERMLSNVDLLGRIGCAMPALANPILDFKPLRALMETALGISAKRSLPHYARERFDKWFAKRLGSAGASPVVSRASRDTRSTAISQPSSRTEAPLFGEAPKTADGAPAPPRRGHVILWDDTFVRYHEPHIGVAAVKVLEALGFEVVLVKNRRCCGRPAFSVGNLDAAANVGKHNISQLSCLRSATARQATLQPPVSYASASNHQLASAPILFLEPSCWSMFVEDYRELNIDGAEDLAKRCFLFEKFVDDLLAQEPDALRFNERSETVAIHPHCHAKSIMDPAFMGRLAERLPGRKATVLDSACCGMAGAFGALAEKYDLSVQVAQRLLDNIDNQRPGTEIIASGTSCRHQISDLSNTRPKHMAELLAEALL
jgi:Fe-S oxidoreductase